MRDGLLFTRVFDIAPGQRLAVNRSDFGSAAGLGVYDWDGLRHVHGGLLWVFQGVMTAHLGDRRWLLTPKDAVWLPPLVDRDVVANVPSRAIFVEWNGVPPSSPVHRMRVDGRAAELLHDLWTIRDPAAVGSLWPRVVRSLAPVADAGLRIPIPEDPRGRDLAARFMHDPADARTLPEWGESTYTSAKTLQRIFLRETGMTFPRWRTQVRLNASLPKLARGISVQDTAMGIGYRSSVGFIGAFAAQFGVTPGRFYP